MSMEQDFHTKTLIVIIGILILMLLGVVADRMDEQARQFTDFSLPAMR